MFSSRVLGRIWPWVLLPFTIPAIPCSQLQHSTLWFWGPLIFILLSVSFYIFLYRWDTLDLGPTLCIFLQRPILYQFILVYRGFWTSCTFGVGHNLTLNRWYPKYSLILVFSWYHEHICLYMAIHSIFYIYSQIEGREAERNEETNSKINQVA